MPAQKRPKKRPDPEETILPLSFFACPNSDCADFNHFDAGNLSIAERMGKDKAIRRLYCKTCGSRFSERQGSLMQNTKLSTDEVVRIIKCLGHGCSVEAAADICEVDARSVQRLLEKSGKRAEDFHKLQLEGLDEPLEVVQLDELHGKTVKSKDRSQPTKRAKKRKKRRRKKRAKPGCTPPWL